MGSMLRSNAVTVGVVCAVDCVKDLVKLGMGNITEKELWNFLMSILKIKNKLIS